MISSKFHFSIAFDNLVYKLTEEYNTYMATLKDTRLEKDTYSRVSSLMVNSIFLSGPPGMGPHSGAP